MPLRKALFFFLAIALLLSLFLSMLIRYGAEGLQQTIYMKYLEYPIISSTYRPAMSEMSDLDNLLVELCDFAYSWSSIIVSMLAAAISVQVFYIKKLKTPLCILEESSEKIAEEQLDFLIEYQNKDEMGKLCGAFEHMRKQLEINNCKMWNMVEEQTVLQASIAHDIRTPLTTIKGYHEMLLEFIPEDKLTKEQIIEFLSDSEFQIERLTNFVEDTKQLTSLKNRELTYKEIKKTELLKKLQKMAEVMTIKNNLSYEVTIIEPFAEKYCADISIIIEVFENLYINALRYANSKIIVAVGAQQQKLLIKVIDDGPGFDQKIIGHLAKGYHYKIDDDGHMGLGLYISSQLCNLHGGDLKLSNNSNTKGACAEATFTIK